MQELDSVADQGWGMRASEASHWTLLAFRLELTGQMAMPPLRCMTQDKGHFGGHVSAPVMALE